MAEEKSIFSKLKPININDEKTNTSTFKIQEQQQGSSNFDTSVKNDINLIKEKISLIEKTISDMSKTSSNQQINELVVSDIKKVVNEEIKFSVSNLNKEMSEVINAVVNNLKSEIMKYVKEEIRLSVEKNMQVIESLKSLSAKDFEKLEHISVKLDFIMKIYDKIKTFEDIADWLRKDMAEEFKKISQRLENVSTRLESSILDELSKNIEKITYEKLHDIRENLIKEFEIVEAELKDEIRKNSSSITDDMVMIGRKIDECRKCIDYLTSLKEKVVEPEMESLLREVKYISETLRELKDKLYNDDDLKNSTSLRKYSVSFVELESKLARIEGLISTILNNIR